MDEDEELLSSDDSEDFGPQLTNMATDYGVDTSGVMDAYNKVNQSAESTRKMLQQTREKILARKFDKTAALLAISSGLLSPTRTGSFGESIGHMSSALQGPVKEKREFEQQQQKDLFGVESGIAGLDDRLAQSGLTLESLKAKLAAQALNSPLEKVIENGKRVLRPRVQARGKEFFVPPTASTNISLNTEKSLYGTLGDKQAAKYSDMWDAARQAPEMLARAGSIRDIMKKSSYTGSLADYKLTLGKALQAAGVNYAKDAATNTEQLAVEMARAALGAINSSGLAGSQGLTEGERKFLERAVAGQITLEPKTIMQLADLNERAARISAKAWNDQFGQLDQQQMKLLGMSQINLGSGTAPVTYRLEDLPGVGTSAPAAPGQPTPIRLEDLP